jgi:hypothetical protein
MDIDRTFYDECSSVDWTNLPENVSTYENQSDLILDFLYQNVAFIWIYFPDPGVCLVFVCTTATFSLIIPYGRREQ